MTALPKFLTLAVRPRRRISKETLIKPVLFKGDSPLKSGLFEGDGLQAVHRCRNSNTALAAEGVRLDLIRIPLDLAGEFLTLFHE